MLSSATALLKAVLAPSITQNSPNIMHSREQNYNVASVGRAGCLVGRRKQSQKHYMVSGSPCPLIIFLDVYFSVSFVVRGQPPP